MSSSTATWHLMKHDDKTVFGPVEFAQIKDWAEAAQISPLDKVSTDELNWIKAPMIPSLEMDWLLQVSDDHFYGPTTLSAIQEFIKEGEISEETIVINCKDSSQTIVRELPFRPAPPPPATAISPKDIAKGMVGADLIGAMLERIETLEKAHDQLKHRVAELEDVLDLPST